MKETKVIRKFSCDECAKQSIEGLEPLPYPFNDGWVYLYDLNFKLSKANIIADKDKHFCCIKCITNYIIKKIKIEEEVLKLNPKSKKDLK